ncbi:MAG: HAD-IA family hydrolase [Candidatus Eremiobacteraeota bacterium]|nr:HAD-IA family hydrolase [Candidatus Eremiobacteraeota bacterium]
MVESEQIWRDVRRGFVTANGGRWRADAAAAMIGMRTTEWSRYIHDQLGVALPPNEIAERVVKAVAQRVERVPVLPGANGALERLATAFRLGLATSAAMPVAQTVLKQTGWGKLFEVVVSSDEVARGKPAPDVYLRALELLDADATRAVAIEDSANGIRSAHAAKLAVVAIPNREFSPDAQSLALASQVIPNLDALDANLVSELLNQRK